MLRKLLPIAAFALALALRIGGSHRVGPYDDAYHLKRIDSFPHTIQLDPDREAWCPWPPLYDFVCGAIGAKAIVWVPPLAFALFAAALAWRFGAAAGFGVALAPYLIGISRVGDIDHHWVEPMLVMLMGLSLIKAALIMAYFMHLRFEKRTLVLTIVPALVVVVSTLSVFFPDSIRLLHMKP